MTNQGPSPRPEPKELHEMDLAELRDYQTDLLTCLSREIEGVKSFSYRFAATQLDLVNLLIAVVCLK